MDVRAPPPSQARPAFLDRDQSRAKARLVTPGGAWESQTGGRSLARSGCQTCVDCRAGRDTLFPLQGPGWRPEWGHKGGREAPVWRDGK